MRRTVLFIVFLSLLLTKIKAQEIEGGAPAEPENRMELNKIKFGAFVAPNISWMHPTASKSDNGQYFVTQKGGKAGFTWGLMAEYMFTENYGFATGFDLNTTGGRIATVINPNIANQLAPNTVLNTDFRYDYQLLEIPAALKLRSDPLTDGGLRIVGEIGLTLCINIGRKVSYDVTYNNEQGKEMTISGDNEKLQGTLAVPPVMLQMNLGAGVEIPITEKMSFYTSLFFNNGFLPDATNPENYTIGYKGTFTDGTIRLNNFGLRLGLFF